jgi:predicted Holliday junction resolvase-like endonuclease
MQKVRRTVQNRRGSAMIVVMCVMALTLVLCLSLLLNASVMMQSSINQKNRQQARILTETLSDAVNRELTVSHTDLFSKVNQAISSGTWLDYEKGTEGHALADVKQSYAVSPEKMPPQMQNALNECSLEMYWVKESPEQNGQISRILFVTVRCTYKGQTSSLTQSYSSTAGVTAQNIPWQNTGIGTAAKGGTAQ